MCTNFSRTLGKFQARSWRRKFCRKKQEYNPGKLHESPLVNSDIEVLFPQLDDSGQRKTEWAGRPLLCFHGNFSHGRHRTSNRQTQNARTILTNAEENLVCLISHPFHFIQGTLNESLTFYFCRQCRSYLYDDYSAAFPDKTVPNAFLIRAGIKPGDALFVSRIIVTKIVRLQSYAFVTKKLQSLCANQFPSHTVMEPNDFHLSVFFFPLAALVRFLPAHPLSYF